MATESRPGFPLRLCRLWAWALMVLLAACAPHMVPAGPTITQPRLLADHWVTADGLELPLRRWLPEGEPGAVILALHGFNDYSAAFEDPGTWWAARGIATYAFDQRGFGAAPNRGLWAGTETLVADLSALTSLLKARYPGRPVYLLGESMGGAVVMVALAADDPIEVDGAIMSAPAVWARSTMPGYQRAALWVGVRIMPWAYLTGEGLAVQASDNIEMLYELWRDPLMIKRTRVDAVYGLSNLMDEALNGAAAIEAPVLLLYGEHDEVIPRDPTFQAWRDLPEWENGRQRLALYEDGWHMLLRDLSAKVVLSDIAEWIADPAATLPSGADDRARAALSDLAVNAAAE